MRTPVIAGNWKMNKTPSEAVEFVSAIKGDLQQFEKIERVVCPPYVALPGVSAALTGSGVRVGAQDVHWEESGAFTSCVAANMLVGIAEYTIIGHSETRQYLGVTDEQVNKKTKAALRHGLKPIIAIGESLAQNEAGQTEEVCDRQIRAALEGISETEMANIIIAYEPIWAIGTGKNATPEQAQSIMGNVVRKAVADLYGQPVAEATRILYGGSMKPANARELMDQPDIDGGLIGGASLKISDYVELVRIAAEAKNLT
ncbi:MAG: triose-phosphate isomerase [Chloroflexi bacterium]|nr:triose-phosphate isomerase [Chloroflexota bacterium]